MSGQLVVKELCSCLHVGEGSNSISGQLVFHKRGSLDAEPTCGEGYIRMSGQ